MSGLSRRQIVSLLVLLFLVLTLPFGTLLVRRQQLLKKRAEIIPPNIIVDAQAVISPLPAFWQNFAQGGEERISMLKETIPQLRTISPHYIRLDHIYDFYDVVGRNRNGDLVFNWQTLDSRVQDILNAGALPFFSLSYMPKVLASSDEVSPPRNWFEWQEIVKRTIQHYSGKSEFNLKNIYYEVWNEPDSFGRFTPGGDRDYRSLYYYAALGASSARESNPFKFGGPAISHLNATWMRAFLEYVSRQNLRLDFISWHVYSLDPRQIAGEAEFVKSWKGQYPNLIQAELVVSEWGSEAAKSFRHNTNIDAAHSVAAVKEAAGAIDLACAFEIKDGPHDLYGGWGMLTYDLAPKPRFSAFQLLNRLKSIRVFLSGEGTNVYALASKDPDESMALILTNYSPFGVDTKMAAPVTFTRLYNGIYRVKKSLLNAGSTITVGSPQTTTVTRGVLEGLIFLPTNSVALVELDRIAPLLSYAPTGRFGYPGDHAALFGDGVEPAVYPVGRRLTAASGTVEMWLKPKLNWSEAPAVLFETSPVNHQRFLARIASKSPLGAAQFGEITKSKKPSLEFGFFEGTSSAKTVTAEISDWKIDEWHHLAFVWDNTLGSESFLRIFIDGRPENTTFGSWKYPLGNSLYLGSNADGGEVTKAEIDELRISSSARYRKNFAIPLSPLESDFETIVLQHFDGLTNP